MLSNEQRLKSTRLSFLALVAITLLYMVTRPANITEEALVEAGETAESP